MYFGAYAKPTGQEGRHTGMEVLGWILWIIGLIIGLSWAYGVRTYVRTGQGVQQQTVNQTALILLAVVAVPLLGLSPLNLLWMLPAAFVVGMLSLAFPFSLISLIGMPFGELCCLGLSQDEITRNRERIERFQGLIASGISLEDAKQELDRDSS